MQYINKILFLIFFFYLNRKRTQILQLSVRKILKALVWSLGSKIFGQSLVSCQSAFTNLFWSVRFTETQDIN